MRLLFSIALHCFPIVCLVESATPSSKYNGLELEVERKDTGELSVIGISYDI